MSNQISANFQLGIVGGGELGQAFRYLCRQHHLPYLIWDRHPERCENCTTLAELASKCDLIILCLPTEALRPICTELATTSNNQSNQLEPIVFTLAKGLEPTTALTAAEVMAQFKFRTGLLYGPALAEEIVAGNSCFITIASANTDTNQTVTELFQQFGDSFWTEQTTAIFETSWRGILKNIYAILFGAAIEAGWSKNQLGWLVSCVCQEATQVMSGLNLPAANFLGLSGIGDFIATSFSEESTHARIGALAVSESTSFSTQVVQCEGGKALPLLSERLNVGNQYQLLLCLANIVASPEKSREILATLPQRWYG